MLNFLNKSLKRFLADNVISASLHVLLLTSVFVLLSALSAQAQTIIAVGGGRVMTCQFVNNSTVPNNQVYICVLANNQYMDINGNMNAIVPGQNASAYSLTLAQIQANSPSGLQFPVVGAGRMWFSYYTPMNMPIVAGPGVVQPNIGNPSDPNINTVFDWMEFAQGNDWIYCNTTQVNMFGIPYTMGLYNQGPSLNGVSGINDCYSDIAAKYQAFMNAIPGASIFNSLVGPVRIVSPGDGTFSAAGANAHYFDAYISQLWTEYQSTQLVISTGGNTYYGTTSGPGSQMVFTGPGGPYYVGYPSTQDALTASGTMATGNPTELALEVVISAGINRHVLDNAANLNNPAAFYQTAPCNYYAAFWHTVNQGGLAYGFPYDDDDNQSGILVSTNARALAVTFSGCINTPTHTQTATPTLTHTNTATSTNTPTVTKTQTSTTTHTVTQTATSSATSTATNSVTNSATSTSTHTVTETPTASMTNSFTQTTTNTATNTANNSSTSTLTATQSATNTATETSTLSFTSTDTTSATPTNSQTATNSQTSTSTGAYTATSTGTSTVTHSATATLTATTTRTSTASSTTTPTVTATQTKTTTASSTFTPLNTSTPTATSAPNDFFISKNVFTSEDPVQISVNITQVPGHYDLTIYNSAGENIKVLDSMTLKEAFSKTYTWNGKNKYGDKCASGIYVIYLTEPLKRLLGRVVFIH